jgi:branched-chain amino acid transport system ATP-binding protein
MQEKPVLEVNHIAVAYGRVMGVYDVSFKVFKGEIVCLLGANGAGKSTTLKAVSGILRTKSGNTYWQGMEITDLHPSEIVSKGIAHCPEGRRLFPDMTVRENLEMGVYLCNHRQTIQQRFDYIYQHLPILRMRSKQLAGTLSGGEQQMVAIGRSLMSKPKVLLLDEPFLGLAPVLIEKIADIILEIRKNGTEIILVEQNARLALTLSSRGYILQNGRVVLEGGSDDLLSNQYIQEAYLGI